MVAGIKKASRAMEGGTKLSGIYTHFRTFFSLFEYFVITGTLSSTGNELRNNNIATILMGKPEHIRDRTKKRIKERVSRARFLGLGGVISSIYSAAKCTDDSDRRGYLESSLIFYSTFYSVFIISVPYE